MVSGRDIRLAAGNGRMAIGFFATRHVFARNGEGAVTKVFDNLREEWKAGTWGEVADVGTPQLAMERCDKIGFIKWLRRPSGYTFYSEE